MRRRERRGRAASTAIYFLLRAGEVSRWHRVDAAEVWHWYAGAPLALTIGDGRAGAISAWAATSPPASARRPWCRRSAWQQARSLGAWTLVGCTVAPGFQFAGFELAPPGFEPLR